MQLTQQVRRQGNSESVTQENMKLRNTTTEQEPVSSTSSEMELTQAEAQEIQVDSDENLFDFGEGLSSTPPQLQSQTDTLQPESDEVKGFGLGDFNLKVTQWENQGDRPYMEDARTVKYQPTVDGLDMMYAFFGVYDGHGGPEAAFYVRENLLKEITSHEKFWSQNDNDVLEAIKLGFRRTHYQLWAELGKISTQSSQPSTAGTTATVCFVRRGKLFIGNVGDSALVLGYTDETCHPNTPDAWKAKQLTKDHKPSDVEELERIVAAGGKVLKKRNVLRVVWKRPMNGYAEPITKSTVYEDVPFLAVARSLGDLWSYNRETNEYIVSPVPDVMVYEINPARDKCIILASDGLWGVLKPQNAVSLVRQVAVTNTGRTAIHPEWENPSKILTVLARHAFKTLKYPADNITVMTILFDPK